MVFIPVAIEAAVLAVEAAEGIVLAGEAAAVVGEVAESAAVVNAGRLGSAMATATNTIALGKSGGILTQVATQVGGNVLFDVAKWAWDKVTGHKDDIHQQCIHEACFSTLDVRMHPTKIEDNFTVTFPAAVASLDSTFDLGTSKADGERINSSRLIGFWGVNIRITEYDPAKLSKWRHPLDRRNFGVVSFCRFDIPFQESSIHFTNHLILCPIVRALSADSVLGDMSQAVANRVHGNLAPGVKAEISFLPVYETISCWWVREKPT